MGDEHDQTKRIQLKLKNMVAKNLRRLTMFFTICSWGLSEIVLFYGMDVFWALLASAYTSSFAVIAFVALVDRSPPKGLPEEDLEDREFFSSHGKEGNNDCRWLMLKLY